jgi:hypothetical protein
MDTWCKVDKIYSRPLFHELHFQELNPSVENGFPEEKMVVNYILENFQAHRRINIWNYFPWGSLFQYIYCFPKGGASTPIRNRPKGM